MVSASERAVRRMRVKVFSYDGTPKEAQADRVFEYLLKRAARERKRERKAVGPYSGLTRSELRRSGTCEADWF